MTSSKRVITFGSFDPLHPGHLWLFQAAKKLGDHLTVVVARDTHIRAHKQHEPFWSEDRRLEAVQSASGVDEALLGDEDPDSYEVLKTKSFDVVAVGYDQRPADSEIHALLQQIGKPTVQVVRLPAYRPEQYKSSLMRDSSSTV